MNQNIKYTICFLLGIILYYFLFNDNMVEGLCPGEENASHVENCSGLNEENCSNSYSSSGVNNYSCDFSNGSCSPLSAPCTINNCSSTFTTDFNKFYVEGDIRNYDLSSINGLSERCSIATLGDSCIGVLNSSGTISCSGTSGSGTIICGSGSIWHLEGCAGQRMCSSFICSGEYTLRSNASNIPCETTCDNIQCCDQNDDDQPASTIKCKGNFDKDDCKGIFSSYNDDNNCSGTCTKKECCDDNTIEYVLSICCCCCCCFVILILLGLTAYSFNAQGKASEIKHSRKAEIKNIEYGDD